MSGECIGNFHALHICVSESEFVTQLAGCQLEVCSQQPELCCQHCSSALVAHPRLTRYQRLVHQHRIKQRNRAEWNDEKRAWRRRSERLINVRHQEVSVSLFKVVNGRVNVLARGPSSPCWNWYLSLGDCWSYVRRLSRVQLSEVPAEQVVPPHNRL